MWFSSIILKYIFDLLLIHFLAPISFNFTFQSLFDLVLHLLFYIISALLYLLTYPAQTLEPKFIVRTNSFIFSPLDIYENTF